MMECAVRRVEREWQVSDCERECLRLVAELSFGLEQSWALVPGVCAFAEATGFHKSTVSRALRSCVARGLLMVLRRRNETLYQLCLAERGERRGQEHVMTAARARLLEINRRRLRGVEDVDGQMRLDGILPNEEIEAPAMAFEAAVEAENQKPESREAGAEDDDPEAALMNRIKAWPLANDAKPVARQPDAAGTDDVLDGLEAELSGKAQTAFQRLREEFATGGRSSTMKLAEWGRKTWLGLCRKKPELVLIACGVHKDFRLTGKAANEPGAFIYRQIQAEDAVAQNTS